MEHKGRQWGIDLARVVSTYGVVFIHSGGYAPFDNLALTIYEFFGFALPFFLSGSFYLLTSSQKPSTASKLIYSRYKRLLLPYFLWSLIYVIAKIIKELFTHKSIDLKPLLQDPFALVFCGSSAVHLYFLPLLFIGNLFAVAIKQYKPSLLISTALFFASLVIYNLLLQISVGFSMNYVQFYSVFYSLQIADIQPVVKFILLEDWFIAICLPYIFFARIIHQWKNIFSPLLHRRNYIILVLVFIIVITLGRSLLPFFINEPIYGCLLLTIALYFPSSLLNDSSKKILLDLSNASFGIYLLHHLVVNLFETIVMNFSPGFMSQVSIVSQILFSTSGFLISWLIVRIFTNKKELIIK